MSKDEHPIVQEKAEEPKSSITKTPTLVDNSTTSKPSQTASTRTKKKNSILYTPSGAFWDLAEAKDEVSRSVSSQDTPGLRGKITVLARKIDWAAFMKSMKEWFKEPMNIAFFIWMTCVTVSCGILLLLTFGLLNSVLPKKSQRDLWYEANNQIVNALFTLICLYQHPQIIYHLFLLIRWNPEDIPKLRYSYSKNATYKPNEWVHMLVVVVMLHVYCLSQYALCTLEIVYSRIKRPASGVSICATVEVFAIVTAGIYAILSPLGKEYGCNVPNDEESQVTLAASSTSMSGKKPNSLEKGQAFVTKEDEDQPEWKGGFFDLCDDISVSSVSFFCTFCVFGWNMNRLGFGNTFVHTATFMLFCTAPFIIFNLAALTLDDEQVRGALGITGCLLCLFGLLYGGYWRMQMRKRYNLPRYTFCCGNSDVTDCALWFFCYWCSLSQEVRTANYYDIVNGKLCTKQNTEDVDQQNAEPPSEDEGTINNTTNPGPNSQVMPSDDTKTSIRNSSVERAEQDTLEGASKPMTPPSPVVIEK